VTGTAINEYDLMTKMEKQAKTAEGSNIVCRTFKAVKDFDQKIVLWPELHSVDGQDPFESVMQDFRNMGTHIAMRELQNEPRDEATAIVKRGWLYRTDGTDWEYDPAELNARLNKDGTSLRLTAIRFGNDPSIGKKSENDPTGFAKVVETRDHNGSEFWIEDIGAEQLTLDGRKDQLVEKARACSADRPVTEVRIEAIGGFDDYATYVTQQTNLPVKRVEWVVDKITNLENRSHYFENGKVHLSKLIPEEMRDKLVHQLTTNYPEHDDIRDAVLLTMDLEAETWEKFMR
jgi:phage terminase large subunit-like protein